MDNRKLIKELCELRPEAAAYLPGGIVDGEALQLTPKANLFVKYYERRKDWCDALIKANRNDDRITMDCSLVFMFTVMRYHDMALEGTTITTFDDQGNEVQARGARAMAVLMGMEYEYFNERMTAAYGMSIYGLETLMNRWSVRRTWLCERKYVQGLVDAIKGGGKYWQLLEINPEDYGLEEKTHTSVLGGMLGQGSEYPPGWYMADIPPAGHNRQTAITEAIKVAFKMDISNNLLHSHSARAVAEYLKAPRSIVLDAMDMVLQ